ncbi:MAG: hypothetical protein ACI9QL_004361, partial [Candidatus Omnitrophota bacterium]
EPQALFRVTKRNNNWREPMAIRKDANTLSPAER